MIVLSLVHTTPARSSGNRSGGERAAVVWTGRKARDNEELYVRTLRLAILNLS